MWKWLYLSHIRIKSHSVASIRQQTLRLMFLVALEVDASPLAHPPRCLVWNFYDFLCKTIEILLTTAKRLFSKQFISSTYITMMAEFLPGLQWPFWPFWNWSGQQWVRIFWKDFYRWQNIGHMSVQKAFDRCIVSLLFEDRDSIGSTHIRWRIYDFKLVESWYVEEITKNPVEAFRVTIRISGNSWNTKSWDFSRNTSCMHVGIPGYSSILVRNITMKRNFGLSIGVSFSGS